MNQPLFINTASPASSKSTSGVHASNTLSQDDKIAQGKAFSNELDKQLDKPVSNSVKSEREVKNADNDKDKSKIETAKSDTKVDEDGNVLPKENLDESDIDENAPAVTAIEGQSADNVVVTSLDTETTETSEEQISIDDEVIELSSSEVSSDDIPQGVAQTQALHDVVHSIKDVVQQQKQVTDETQAKNEIGKRVSETVKNMTKPNAVQQAATDQISIEEVVVQEKVVNAQSSTEKELGAVKLRPDILQALSLRAADAKQHAQTTVETNNLDLNLDKNIATVKTTNAQLQLPELLERMGSKTLSTQAQSVSDRIGLGLTSASTVSAAQVKADVPVLDIQPSLQNAAWSRVMTSRVLWMAREGVQEATLKLNPAQLGPVEVRLNMHQEQAHVTFIAHSAVTRDALEQAIPRLRESFTQHGLELANADVSQQSFSQSGESEQQGNELGSGSISRDMSHNTDSIDDQDDKIVDNEQQLELGLSIYA